MSSSLRFAALLAGSFGASASALAPSNPFDVLVGQLRSLPELSSPFGGGSKVIKESRIPLLGADNELEISRLGLGTWVRSCVDCCGPPWPVESLITHHHGEPNENTMATIMITMTAGVGQ